jgi:hypothetical protein
MNTKKTDGYWLYFAYGSNMNAAQMAERCIAAEPIAVARYPDHAIGFFGHSRKWDGAVATCLPAPGKDLWGVVYKLSVFDGDSLDTWQDVRLDGNGAYFHYPAQVVDSRGTRYNVLLYKKDMLGAPKPPSREYLDFILSGATFHGLPADYVESLRTIATKEASYPVPRSGKFAPSIAAGADCSSCGELPLLKTIPIKGRPTES